MKPRYFGWRPTTAMAKRFKDGGIPCACPTCLERHPERAEARDQANAEVRDVLNGQRLTEVES